MERLTIAEYAERKNISVQAVYKRIEKLKTIKEERNGRIITLIEVAEDGEAEKLNPTQPNLNEVQPNLNPISTDNQPQVNPISTDDIKPYSTQGAESSPLIELLKRQLEEKDRQLQEKDKQIERLQSAGEEKDKQIQEQFERLSSLLLRSQELEAMTHRLLLEQPPAVDSKDKEQPPEPVVMDEQPPADEVKEQEPPEQPTAEEQPPARKSFWRRLFGI